MQLNALNDVSDEMRDRLRRMIVRRDPHFVLTGTDPADIGGCCPSNEVGYANRLVRAGILESWGPPAGPEDCPSRFYAFRNEINVTDDQPRFTIDVAFRDQVAECLSETRPRRPAHSWIRRALLAFVAVSVAVFIGDELKGRTSSGRPAEAAIADQCRRLENGVLVCLLTSAQSCAACDAMRAFTNRALEEHFGRHRSDGKLRFAEISVAGDVNRDFREKHELLATSLMLVEARDGLGQRRKVLAEAWHLTGKEEAFIRMLRQQLNTFMEANP